MERVECLASKKYLADWRLENVQDDAKGKIVTKTVYRGEYFVFADEKLAHQARRIYPVGIAVCCACLTVLLSVNFPAGHQMYCMLPLVCCSIPLFFCVTGCFSLCAIKGPATREQRDHIGPRLTGTLFALMLFSGVSLIGQAIYAFTVSWDDVSLWMALCTVLLFTCALFLFRKKDCLTMIPKPQKECKAAPAACK